jgi:gliding motility-associated-like protein
MKLAIKNIFLGSLLFAFNQSVNAQCTVTIETVSDSVDCGDCFNLEAVGSAEDELLNEDFNASSLGTGWFSNQTVMYTNPCGAPPDGSPSAWFGNAQTQPRILETIDYDVTCGGELCFDMMYAEQSGSGSCEGPDQANEGVKVQYSTDGGATWVTIFDHVPLAGGYDPYQTSWQEYCHIMPVGAQTTSTRFRWYQDAGSGAGFDHWGIDDVSITGQLCNTYYYDWSVNGITNGPDTTDCINGNEQDYTVIYTDGISDTCSATITMYSSLSPNLTPDTLICGLTDLDLLTNPTGGSGNYNYEWISGETSTEITIDSTNTYWVEITDVNFPGCVSRDSSLIEIYPSPVVDFSAFPLCQGSLTEFTDLTSLPPGTDVTGWNWSFDDNAATSNQQNPFHGFSGVGLYDVTLSVMTEDGCPGDTTLQIEIEPSPFANFDFDDVCVGEIVQFTNQSIGNYENLEWNFGETTDTLTGEENPTYQYGVDGNYNVTLIVTDSAGVCSDTTIKTVQVFELPIIDFTANPTIGEPPLPVTFFNNSSGAIDYTWDFDNGISYNSTEDTLYEQFTVVGNYDVLLTGISPEGCENNKIVTVIVEYPAVELVIPNVFTPNSDNSNDFFLINYNDALETITSFEIVILNRWGNVLRTFDDPLFKWDGTTEGDREVGDGTYFYKVNIETKKGQIIEEHGFVQLVRD